MTVNKEYDIIGWITIAGVKIHVDLTIKEKDDS